MVVCYAIFGIIIFSFNYLVLKYTYTHSGRLLKIVTWFGMYNLLILCLLSLGYDLNNQQLIEIVKSIFAIITPVNCLVAFLSSIWIACLDDDDPRDNEFNNL